MYLLGLGRSLHTPFLQPHSLPGALALVLVMGPLAAEAACQDRGCDRQHSGQGVCVDLWTLSASALGASYDLAAGAFSGSCDCSSQDCDCRCFKRVGDQSGPACQKSKNCSKKKGTCLKQGSQPEGSKDLGWCSKKSRCKCYKSAPPVPPPATTCQGRWLLQGPVQSSLPRRATLLPVHHPVPLLQP